MRDIFGVGGRAILSEYTRERVMVGLDFDGTLAPLNRDRDSVQLSSSIVEQLKRLSAMYPVAIVSGRAREDLKGRLAGTGVHHIVGNHGLEPSEFFEECCNWTARTAAHLARVIPEDAEIDLEDKTCSLSLHWANARDFSAARETIGKALASLPEPARVIDGKGSLSLVKPDTADKGKAINALAQHESVEHVIYVGDDETDEDVFRSPAPSQMLGVRVGPSANSGARYYLPEQRHIGALLDALVAART